MMIPTLDNYIHFINHVSFLNHLWSKERKEGGRGLCFRHFV